jgi:Xaa-Pro aminopeptidase
LFRQNFRREPLFYPGDELHKAKSEKLQRALVENNLDAFLLLRHERVRYATDFYVKAYRPVPEYEYLSIIARGRDPMIGFTQNSDTLRIYSRALQDDIRKLPELAKWADVIKQVLQDYGLTKGRIGVDILPYQVYTSLKEALPGIEIVDINSLWSEITSVKHEVEIDFLRKASRLADIGLEAAVNSVKEGIREYEIAAAAESAMMSAGSEYTPVLPNMISGKNFSIYERVASEKRIQNGDTVIFDTTAIYRGYAGDVGYTIVAGKATDMQKEAYAVALSALRAGIKASRPGARCSDVDAAVKEVIMESSFAKYIQPGLVGHQLGFGWEHHAPLIGPDVHDRLKPGMVMAIEPGIVGYDQPNAPGAHVENSLVITETGNEVITTYKFAESLAEIV